MILNVVTPYGAKFEGVKVASVTLPGKVGEMQILPGHEALMAALRVGVMRVSDAQGHETIAAISGGYVEVLADTVNCLVETCETRDEIDVARARQKLESVRQALKDAEPNTKDYQRLQLSMAKAEIRIQVAGKTREN